MEQFFLEKTVDEAHRQNGMNRLWELDKFPFKVRIGEVARKKGVVFYWTVFGSLNPKDEPLKHGKETDFDGAVHSSLEAIKPILLDLEAWLKYAAELR